MQQITVYSMENCRNCEMIKGKLSECNVSFTEVKDREELLRVSEITGLMTAPIVEINGDFFTGVEAIKHLGL